MANRKKLIKLLPSYVGSKAYWVDYLDRYKNRNFVELFAGSAVLSVNLAQTSVINDIDYYLYKIFSDYGSQIVPEVFTKDDYFRVRGQKDWYKYVFCLQKMSFSGVFRYSKNGFNVPIKPIEFISVKDDYLIALDRFKQLNPVVLNRQYYECNEFIKEDSVLVLDPPYENGQANYNSNFDYEFYWQFIRLNENAVKTLILFDYEHNLPFEALAVRNMRVNGALRGAKEGIFIFEDSLKEGQKGEDLFFGFFPDVLNKLSGYGADFALKDGRTVELKSDYYNMNRTKNFFFERYSKSDRKSAGGPWQALEKNIDFFVYWFPANKYMYLFRTKDLVSYLDKIAKNYKLVDVPNKGYITSGYKIPRNLLKDIILKERDV